MDTEFWRQRWANDSIDFHNSEPNARLVNHFARLKLAAGSRVFLPLCGKTLDIQWLLTNGYRVVGAELSELAIEQLFAQLGIQPTITGAGAIIRYQAEHIDILVGDIFTISTDSLGAVDAVYDRAALVALPEAMRVDYAEHIVSITGTARQLLICYDYDQRQMPGPPFAVNAQELGRLYHQHYQMQLLESSRVEGGLKGRCAATQTVWLLDTD